MKPPQVNPQKIISHSLIQEAANGKDSSFLVYSSVILSESHLFQSDPAPWSEHPHHFHHWAVCTLEALLCGGR